MELKENLLKYDIFINNEYLDKYCNLININKETKKEKFKTQKHHIIPKCYYRYKKLEIDNSVQNLVNLQHKDHALAHYYLCLCISDKRLRHALISALIFITNSKLEQITEVDLIKFLPYYQTLCELRNKYRSELYKDKKKGPFTEEHKQKLSLAHKGYKPSVLTKEKISKANKGKHYHNIGRKWSEETKQKMSKSKKGKSTTWSKGKSRNNEIKAKLSESIKGRIRITNTFENKMVKREELSVYLKEGWKKGLTRGLKNNNE